MPSSSSESTYLSMSLLRNPSDLETINLHLQPFILWKPGEERGRGALVYKVSSEKKQLIMCVFTDSLFPIIYELGKEWIKYHEPITK